MSQSETQASASQPQPQPAKNEIAIRPVKYDPNDHEEIYNSWVNWLLPVDFVHLMIFKDDALYATLNDDDDAKRAAMTKNGKPGVDDDTVTVHVMSKEESEDVHRKEKEDSHGGLGGHVPA